MNKEKLTLVIGSIILIVLILSVIANLNSSLGDGADSITDANDCSTRSDTNGNALIYNITDKWCYNTTASAGNTTGAVILAGQYDLPLNTLFGRTGVTLLIVMAGLFILLISVALKKKK